MKLALFAALGCLIIRGVERAQAFIPPAAKTPGQGISSRSSCVLFSSQEPLASEGDWAAYLDEETTGR